MHILNSSRFDVAMTSIGMHWRGGSNKATRLFAHQRSAPFDDSFLDLLQVILCYKVKKCGTDFRWNMFGMTVKDADNLGSGLKVCKKLSK